MKDEIVIDIKNVSFGYGREPVLENVNISVRQNDFASIVGPNGSGKTTLLKLLLGLLPPDKGSITILGKTPEKARLDIGYMPQYAHLDMKYPVTVMDVVLMGRLHHNLGFRFSRKDREIAYGALEEVKLKDISSRVFSELSGGQRQRVLIARALCCKPAILFLDEPTSNMDPEVEEALFTILQDLNKRMTILLVSHDLGFVSKVVKSVICVNRKVVVHPTSEINGTMINEIYGGDLRMVRHDHICSEGGHIND
ncbi:MAG: ABC transporter ATP-binding protein [Proteobacteria bacterium]|nr:ABC transporter ATP-binding protein [Pseudomonadota bacterium]